MQIEKTGDREVDELLARFVFEIKADMSSPQRPTTDAKRKWMFEDCARRAFAYVRRLDDDAQGDIDYSAAFPSRGSVYDQIKRRGD